MQSPFIFIEAAPLHEHYCLTSSQTWELLQTTQPPFFKYVPLGHLQLLPVSSKTVPFLQSKPQTTYFVVASVLVRYPSAQTHFCAVSEYTKLFYLLHTFLALILTNSKHYPFFHRFPFPHSQLAETHLSYLLINPYAH